MDKVKKQFLITLGKRISTLRERQGLTQSEVAKECEKDRQSINRLEKGNVNPSIYYLYQISLAIGINLEELFQSKDIRKF